MITTFLQDILDGISSSNLPYNWNSFNLKTFSRDKTLWDFQQKAVENALKVLILKQLMERGEIPEYDIKNVKRIADDGRLVADVYYRGRNLADYFLEYKT